jgi:uncharacterized ion transporter superfamily protein YfcC
MAEESLAFYALVITVMIAAGYDALVGAAVLLLGCGIGTLGSTLNPFATGIASGFAGVSISEGIVGRLVILVLGLAIGIWFVLRYADKVKRDPAASMVHDMKEDNEAHFRATAATSDLQALTGKHKLILAVFGLAVVVMMYGVIPWEDLGVPKDLVVTAYQSASGLMNLFIPTSAVVMGGLAIARVPYGRYLRWVWPLLAMLAALTIVVLTVGALLA